MSIRAGRPSWARLLLAAPLLAACHTGTLAPAAIAPDSAAIRADIAYLASDALEGRGTGTAGNDSAAAYIARRYQRLGLTPVVPAPPAARCPSPVLVLRAPAADGSAAPVSGSRCHCFLQPFSATSVAAAHAGLPGALPTQNVLALLRGTDPKLRDQYVVIGAHFDHLGRNAFGALDPEAKDAIRNGADDNASGTAAVLELARIFAKHPAKRSIIFANFSGEELGLLGSGYMVEHFPVPLGQVAAMLNFDMVGRLRDDKLIVYGTGSATEMPAILDSANVAPRLDVRGVGDGYGPSDQSSFYAKGVPVLHFFTDLHEDYHRATDDVEKINAGGEARVVAFAARVAREIADRPARLTYVQSAPPPMTASSRESTNVYLGTIPDMGAADVTGVRLTGVRAGTPADKAGLKAGDVIVEFGGDPVKDLYEYTAALNKHKPGDSVTIVVERAGQRVTLTATLGARGG
ncbi:MAG TPA: M28 family peptidase [Gemmatimonadaceae bacterium]|nr:M28 family peptidase [Gemmatimonadaceae bacterium]